MQVESLETRGRGVTERESLGMSELKNVVFFEQLQWMPPPLDPELWVNDDSQARSECGNESENLGILNLGLHPRGVLFQLHVSK